MESNVCKTSKNDRVMQTENIKLTKLKLNPNNPRLIKDDKYKKLVKSITDFPKMLEIRPIVVNDDMVVLGGNQRLKACKESGFKEVPTIKASELTEDEQREFIIKDNIGFGDNDWDMLANEWNAEELEDWGMDLPEGWGEEEPEAHEDEFDEEPPEEPITQFGDLYEIGNHRLLCGSSLETEKWQYLMNDRKFDLVMTDPPYNVDYTGGSGLKMINDKNIDSDFYKFLFDFYTALGEFTKKGGAWYVWHADSEGANFRQAMEDAGIMVKQCLIWVKNAMVMGRQDYQWKHEPCLYGWKEGASHYFTNERHHTTVIEDKVDLKKLKKEELLKIVEELTSEKTPSTVIHHDKPTINDVHPTMKPILLIAPLIKNSSKKEGLVGDGFLGSGSTMVAAHQLKRKCYGMELDPKYCDVIVKRMIKLDPTLTIKRNGEMCKEFE